MKPEPKPCKHCGQPARVMKSKKTESGWTTNQTCEDCSWLYSQYRIRKPDFDEMFEKQTGECGICHTKVEGTGYKKLHVDHCHDTGKVRGLLCMNCNTAIGKLPDVSILESAVRYLNEAAS